MNDYNLIPPTKPLVKMANTSIQVFLINLS